MMDMAFNISQNNPGQFANINFGSNPITLISSFYYNIIDDTICAHQIVENVVQSELMNISSDGTVYIKGIKILDSTFTRRFDLTKTGNLVAKAFTTEI